MAFLLRRWRWILPIPIVAVVAYQLPSVASNRRKVVKFVNAVSFATDIINTASPDLNDFLRSDSDEVPFNVLKAVRMMESQEFLDGVSSFSRTLAATGIENIRTKDEPRGTFEPR